MSGIAGVFNLDGRPVEVEEVRRVWFDGRLDNREALASGDVSDAAAVLAAYEQFGDDFAAHLNGDFAVALMDSSRRQLLLARDVMGARRLYYCPLPGAVLFASEIKSLLADPRVSAVPDEDGLADLVLNNWYDDHRTCFKSIYSVPAGHVVVATRDAVARRVHWAFDPSREIRYGSFEEYRDEFRALFEQSVRRRLRSADPVAVTVSGGVDSSSIFCQAATLIRRESLPIRLHGIAMTFPEGTAADERTFLAEIERAYGTPVERVGVSRLEFLTDGDAVVRQLETPSLAAHVHAEIFEVARRAGCRVVLSGYCGDQMLFGRDYLVDLARQGRWLKIRHDLREFSAWMTEEEPGVFEQEFWSRMVRALPPRWLFRLGKRLTEPWRAKAQYSPLFTSAFRARARSLLSARPVAPGRSATAHAEQCYRHATSGHYASTVRLESGIGSMHGVDVRYPFRDRDLVAFLMAIPGEIVNWQGVPKGLLRHALSGVLPDAVRDRRSKADFTELYQESVRNSRADLARLVPRNALAVRAGMIDGDALESGAPLDWQMADPIGLELWLRNFFGSGRGASS